jgi:hypothetical protein
MSAKKKTSKKQRKIIPMPGKVKKKSKTDSKIVVLVRDDIITVCLTKDLPSVALELHSDDVSDGKHFEDMTIDDYIADNFDRYDMPTNQKFLDIEITQRVHVSGVFCK